MIDVGFTGSRVGMTRFQRTALRDLFNEFSPIRSFHHGDCIGADAKAHEIAQDLGLEIHLHPPTNPRMRAFCKGAAVEYPKEPYIARNHSIVRMSGVVIAVPAQRTEVLRSGTWATIRFARKSRTRLVVIFPDGSVQYE